MKVNLINLKICKCAVFTIITSTWLGNKEDYHDSLYSYRENTVTVIVIPICGSKALDFCWKEFR